jgi:hypothetical protein
MFRLDDRTDEESQGIEERLLRRGGFIRDEGRRTDRPPVPRSTLQTSLMRINYFVKLNGHDAAEGGDSPHRLPASFTPINTRGKSSTYLLLLHLLMFHLLLLSLLTKFLNYSLSLPTQTVTLILFLLLFLNSALQFFYLQLP